jgi:hypothetical protein
MRFTSSSRERMLFAISTKADSEVVELCLIDGTKHEALRALFANLWTRDRFRVTLDCSHVDDLTLPEVFILDRFSNEFSCHGGFVRLTKVNTGVRSLLSSCRSTKLLAPHTRAAKLGGARVGKKRSYAQQH